MYTAALAHTPVEGLGWKAKYSCKATEMSNWKSEKGE